MKAPRPNSSEHAYCGTCAQLGVVSLCPRVDRSLISTTLLSLAQVLLVPSAFTVPTGKAHWEVLLRARAIETQAYVIASAQVGAPIRTAQGRGQSARNLDLREPAAVRILTRNGRTGGVVFECWSIPYLTLQLATCRVGVVGSGTAPSWGSKILYEWYQAVRANHALRWGIAIPTLFTHRSFRHEQDQKPVRGCKLG